MAEAVNMPKYGMTMEEGAVARWHKNVGDAVRRGEILLEVEADKALMEVQAEVEGVLLQIAVPEGQTVPCGTVLAWVGAPGDAVPS